MQSRCLKAGFIYSWQHIKFHHNGSNQVWTSFCNTLFQICEIWQENHNKQNPTKWVVSNTKRFRTWGIRCAIQVTGLHERNWRRCEPSYENMMKVLPSRTPTLSKPDWNKLRFPGSQLVSIGKWHPNYIHRVCMDVSRHRDHMIPSFFCVESVFLAVFYIFQYSFPLFTVLPSTVEGMLGGEQVPVVNTSRAVTGRLGCRQVTTISTQASLHRPL